MYSSIPNTERDSNFWTLNFRYFVSWSARKLTNASVINNVTDICIFQVNITVLKDFSRLFHTYDHFQDFSWPTLNSRTFHTFPGSVRTLNRIQMKNTSQKKSSCKQRTITGRITSLQHADTSHSCKLLWHFNLQSPVLKIS